MSATLSPILKEATPVQAVSGRGAVLVDEHGRQYLDFTAGIAATKVMTAITTTLADPATRTRDLGGAATTGDVVSACLATLA